MASTSGNKPVLALFDFDGTITRRDTLPLFIGHAHSPGRLCVKAFKALPPLAGYALGLIGNQRAKELLLAAFFKGWTRLELERTGADFARRVIGKLLRPEALERLEEHRRRGHRVLIISASPEEWVRPWAESLGLTALATRLEYVDELFTGRFDGPNCRGEEKVRRLREHLETAPENFYIHAYGDSAGDRAMLELADEPFWLS